MKHLKAFVLSIPPKTLYGNCGLCIVLCAGIFLLRLHSLIQTAALRPLIPYDYILLAVALDAVTVQILFLLWARRVYRENQ